MSDVFILKTGTVEGQGSASEKEVQLSRDLIERWSSRQREWADEALKDQEFRSGIQWSDKEVLELSKQRRAATVWNLLHPAVEMEKALLTDNTPRFQATAKEHSDRDYAALVSDLMSHIWYISNGDVAFKQAVDDYAVFGRGAFQVYVDSAADYGRGEVKVRSLYPLHVYPDPNSQDPFCRDSAHILVCCMYSAEQIQRDYPGYWADIEKNGKTTTVQRDPVNVNQDPDQQREASPVQGRNTEGDYYEVIDRYSKVLVKRIHILNTETGREDDFTAEEYSVFLQRPAFIIIGEGGQEISYSEEDVAQIQAMITEAGTTVFHQMPQIAEDEYGMPVELDPIMMPGEPHEGAIPGSRIEFELTTYNDVLAALPFEKREIELLRVKRVLVIGERLCYSGVMDIENYPIVVLNNNHARNPYPLSDVRMCRDLQQYYNKMKSLILAHTANSAGTKVMVPRGSDVKEIEQNWGKAGVSVIEVDMEIGQPVVAQVPPLSNQLFMEVRDAEHKIQKVFGIYDMQMGDASSAPNTYKGTLAIEEYGQRRMRSKRESIETFLNAVAAVVAELIPQVYTHNKIIRLFQPNQKPKELELNIPVTNEYTGEVIQRTNDIASLRYDIIVVSGSTLPSNRWARFEAMQQLFSVGLIDDVAMLQYVDIPNVEDILARKSQMSQLMQQNAALQEEVKRLSGDLQTAQREAVHAKQRVEVEKFSAALAEKGAAFDAEAYVMAQRTKDAVSDTKTIVQLAANAMVKKESASSEKEES